MDRKTNTKSKFREPLLQMNYAGRLTARIVMNVWLVVHIVTTIVFLLSDIQLLFWIGVMSTLYFANRALYFNHADSKLPLRRVPAGNITKYIRPRAKRFIILGYNKAVLLGGDFYLNLARELSETRSVKQILKKLEVKPEEFFSKLEVHLKKSINMEISRAYLADEVEKLALIAYTKRKKGQKFIDHIDLFVSLRGIGDGPGALFDLFDISSEKLEQAAESVRLNGYNKSMGSRRKKVYVS